jgi:hypothetical protein
MTESVGPPLPTLLADAVAEFEVWMQGELLADQTHSTPRSPLYRRGGAARHPRASEALVLPREADVKTDCPPLPVSILPSRRPPFDEPGVVPIDLRWAPAPAGLLGRQRRLSWGLGLGAPSYLPHILRLSQPVLSGLAAEGGLVALSCGRQTQGTLGFQILPRCCQLLFDGGFATL